MFSCLPLSGQDSILEPLCFPEQQADGSSAPSLHGPTAELLVCLFCPESAPLQQKDGHLKHLLLEHKLVIADVKLIADLPKYEACTRSVYSGRSKTELGRSFLMRFLSSLQVPVVLEGQILGAAGH